MRVILKKVSNGSSTSGDLKDAKNNVVEDLKLLKILMWLTYLRLVCTSLSIRHYRFSIFTEKNIKRSFRIKLRIKFLIKFLRNVHITLIVIQFFRVGICMQL